MRDLLDFRHSLRPPASELSRPLPTDDRFRHDQTATALRACPSTAPNLDRSYLHDLASLLEQVAATVSAPLAFSRVHKIACVKEAWPPFWLGNGSEPGEIRARPAVDARRCSQRCRPFDRVVRGIAATRPSPIASNSPNNMAPYDRSRMLRAPCLFPVSGPHGRQGGERHRATKRSGQS
jgi:hypothetical protein